MNFPTRMAQRPARQGEPGDCDALCGGHCGAGIRNRPEHNRKQRPDASDSSEKIDEIQQIYLKFPIDLTEALAQTGW